MGGERLNYLTFNIISLVDRVPNWNETFFFFSAILETLCDELLRRNVSAILYLFNMETFGRATASVQYFFQLSSYLRIPVISWNADNSGLERVRSFK